jgi:mannose-6-phosphate isomerase-like protein (cupin superfamily)
MAFGVGHLDELERIAVAGTIYRPVRRALGVTAFGVNAYTADRAGDELIETHDETTAGSARHEELYVVVTGRATFTVDGQEVDAPVGTLVLVPPGVRRAAAASADDTSVLVIGGAPGAAGPLSPFEYWYAATPAYEAGDFARAYEIARAGLEEHPDNGSLHYNLACYAAMAGYRDEALRHLTTAVERDPRTREWAGSDSDLDAIRDDPAFPA